MPYPGTYKVILNSEMNTFGGNWESQNIVFETVEVPHKGQPYSLEIILPSLAAFALEPQNIQIKTASVNQEAC